jgi:CTP:phosphocholine cytidylyltransferase-like protein
MDIGTKKLELIEWLIKLNDNSIIDYLNSIKDSEKSTKDWWEDLSSEQIKSINRGIKDIDEGRIHSHVSVMKKYESFL